MFKIVIQWLSNLITYHQKLNQPKFELCILIYNPSYQMDKLKRLFLKSVSGLVLFIISSTLIYGEEINEFPTGPTIDYGGSIFCPIDIDPTPVITGDNTGTFSSTSGLVIDTKDVNY